jgi:hypothetical protein
LVESLFDSNFTKISYRRTPFGTTEYIFCDGNCCCGGLVGIGIAYKNISNKKNVPTDESITDFACTLQ